MSDKAYKDEARKIEISIDDAVISNNKHYYCINGDCNAVLYVRNNNGIKSAHFCAYAKHPHIAGCYASNSRFRLDEFQEEKFKYYDAMGDICLFENRRKKGEGATKTEGNDSSTDRPLKTLREIYLMCKSKGIHEEYAGMKISEMLADARTSHIYLKYGPLGIKIVECCYKKYNASENEIFVDYCGKELKLQVNNNLFREVNNRLYPNREFKLAIAGEWKSCATTINSKKQIYIVK